MQTEGQVVPAEQIVPPAPVTTTPPAPAPTTPAPNGAPDGEPLPQGMAPNPGGGVQVLSNGAYKRLKDEAKEKGKREAEEAMAKDLGYSSVEEMRGAFSVLKRSAGQQPSTTDTDPDEVQPEPTPTPTPSARTTAAGVDAKEFARVQREREQAQRERDEARRKQAREEQKRKEAEAARDAKEAEYALRETAAECGVKGRKNINYALHLLQEHLSGQSEEALKAFDEAKFFKELRAEHGYLFGEVVVPATTGTGASGAPPPPKPGAAVQAGAQSGQVDAKKMSPEEYRKHLAARGLNLNL